jgi:hypothetical protein
MRKLIFPMLIALIIAATPMTIYSQWFPKAPVYGKVYFDHNENGVQDADEPAALDVRVEVVLLSENAVRLWAGRSGNNGEYSIEVEAGKEYQLHAYCPAKTGEICSWLTISVSGSIEGVQVDIPMSRIYQVRLPFIQQGE